MRKLTFWAFALAMSLLPLASQAADMRSGEALTIGSGQVIEENLYAAGAMVSLDGEVRGDAHVVGGNLTVTGPVSEDLAAAAGSLVLLGPVGGDLRFAGGNVTFSSTVGGELVAVGGNITITPGVTVGGDATVAGGNVIIKGNYGGDLAVYAGEVRIDGTIEGNLLTKAESVTLASGAVVRGSYLHEGPQEATIESGAVISGGHSYNHRVFSAEKPDFDREVPWKPLGQMFGAMFLFFVLVKFLAHLVASLLATWQLPRLSGAVVNRNLKNFGIDLLTGLLVAILAPIALIILYATVVGWVVACLLLAALCLAGIVAGIYTSVSFGALIRGGFAKKRPKEWAGDWKSALLGTPLLTLVVLIPFVGWLVGLVFYLASFGSVVRLGYEGLFRKR